MFLGDDMLYEVLNKLNITYTELEHKAVYTIEEALQEDIPSKIDGIECKNLFVKYKEHYYLIFLEASKRADLKELAKLVQEPKLSFASEEELQRILGLSIGSVTPLGIIHDQDCKVTLLLDQELIHQKVLVHPNVNTKTISISFEDLIHYIEYFNHSYILF